MNESPLVSVVIPTYNRPQWLTEAVNSVLNQTYSNYEVLIVDDGSEEDIASLDVLQNAKIRYFKNINHGVAYSRNFGMRQAKGKYVAFLDSDDFWDSRKLEIQISEMEKTDSKWSQHCYYYFNDDTQQVSDKINTYRYKDSYEYVQFCSFKVQTSCFVVNRDAAIFNDCFFDESKTFGEDSEFYLKMMKLFPLLFINEYLGYFRVKATNAGKNVQKQITSRAVFWKEHGHEQYVLQHVSRRVKFAYLWCVAIHKDLILSNDIIAKIAYVLPWTVFKLETKSLERRNA